MRELGMFGSSALIIGNHSTLEQECIYGFISQTSLFEGLDPVMVLLPPVRCVAERLPQTGLGISLNLSVTANSN
jgi:hypothetical protein